MIQISQIEQDPELVEDDEHGVGQEDAYDGLAVVSIEFDPAQFELPNDYEHEDDDDE